MVCKSKLFRAQVGDGFDFIPYTIRVVNWPNQSRHK